MFRTKYPFLIVVLLIGLSACGVPASPTPPATPTFTPWVGGTETALAASASTPTPWVAGTETAFAAENPSATPLALPTLSAPATFTPFVLAPGMFTPVLYGDGPFLLLGGFKRDHGWLSGDQAAQFMGNPMSYDFHGSSGPVQIQGSLPEYSPICRNYFVQSVSVLPEPMIGVAGGWVQPQRGATDLATDDPAYVQAVQEWFESQGNSPAQIRITRILQVDLDGDGVNEVLLSASYFKEKLSLLTETGDYSVVLMRKVIGNAVVTVPLVKDYYVSSVPEFEVSYPNTYALAGVLDLNGDGTLEVIVDVTRWEGGGAIVYRVDGQNVREVMRAICGSA